MKEEERKRLEEINVDLQYLLERVYGPGLYKIEIQKSRENAPPNRLWNYDRLASIEVTVAPQIGLLTQIGHVERILEHYQNRLVLLEKASHHVPDKKK